MKKSKVILIVFLVLAIITSLTAGTLAIYTSTVDLESNTVNAKAFAMTAASQDTQGIDLKLAPDDIRAKSRGEEVTFVVRNYDGDTVSEVPLEIRFSLNLGGDLFKVPGLDVKIIDNADKGANDINRTGKSSWLYGYSVDGNGRITTYGPERNASNRKIILPGGSKQERTFRIRLQWLNNGSNEVHTLAGVNQLKGTVSLTVNAVQYTGR